MSTNLSATHYYFRGYISKGNIKALLFLLYGKEYSLIPYHYAVCLGPRHYQGELLGRQHRASKSKLMQSIFEDG